MREQHHRSICGAWLIMLMKDEANRQANSRLGINKVAVLTSVNLADELFRLRKEVRELENMLKKKNTK